MSADGAAAPPPFRRPIVAGGIALLVVLAACLLAVRAQSPYRGDTVGNALGGIPGTVRPSPPPRRFRGPIRQGRNIVPPRKIVHVDPIWPEAARACDLRGTVIVELTLDTDGRVAATNILRSIPGLDAAALSAVRQWVFEPFRMNGELYSIVVAVTVTFPPAVVPPSPDSPGGSLPASAESPSSIERLRNDLERKRLLLAGLAADVARLDRMTIDAPRSRVEPLRTRAGALQREIQALERQLRLAEAAERSRNAAAGVR